MKFYVSVLDSDCQPHYFEHADNAIRYLRVNNTIPNCKVEPNQKEKLNGEVWDKHGVSVGYFYQAETEDSNRKNIYLIVGKSGSGKSTIVHELCKRYGYKEVQSYTERPKRYEDEIGHIFVTKEEFDKLEDLCAYTLFNGNRYGVPASMIEECDLYVIDTAGVNYMYDHYNGTKNIIVIGICCSEDDTEDTYIRLNRMMARGDSRDEAVERIHNDDEAFADFNDLINYKVINSDLEDAINQIQEIISNTQYKKED